MKKYFVYIMTNCKNGTLYIGVTSDIIKRIWEHKNNLTKGFTEKYNIHLLVYYEEYSDIRDAINREKNMKTWKRDWKIELIEKSNPEWIDLYRDLIV